MFTLKKALVSTAALISWNLLLPAQALAVSCPATITGTALSGVVCDFDTGSGVTVSTGGEVDGINQQAYAPANSFILNDGTIGNNTTPGIYIDNSSLSNGLANNGVITTDDYGILIDNTSTVSGGISNTGDITTANAEGLRVSGNSTVNGNITNSGNIISNSANDVAMLLFGGSVVNGDIVNDGTLRAFGIGSSLLNFNSSINGGITNNGTIQGGQDGLTFSNVANVTGDITNNGSLIGDTHDGLIIINGSTAGGDITNNGTITGADKGISVDSFGTVNGIILNQAGKVITGGVDGIFVNDSSVVAGGIQNHGTITGGTHGIFISADSTVNYISLYSGSRVIGAIDAIGANVDVLGDFASEGAMNVNTVSINAGSIFTMSNAITAQTAVTNAGTLNVGAATRTITGDYTQSTGGALKVGVQNMAAYGQLITTGTADFSQSGAINVDVANRTNLTIGSVLTNVISGGALIAPGGGFTVTDNSQILNFTGALNGGTGVNLTAVAGTSVSQSNAAAGNTGGMGAAGILDGVINANPGGDWQNILNALFSLGNNRQVSNATNQTTPALAGAAPTAIMETMSAALRAVQARLESNAGLSAGEDYVASRNAWFKTFGSWGNQGTSDGVVGYDSNAYGLIIGADKDVSEKARLGGGISYFNSRLNNPDDQVDVDSYLATVYGSYSLDDQTDVSAQADGGYNSSDTRRNITFGGLNRIATGGYGGWSFHAGTGIGHALKLNIGRNTALVPQARLDYFTADNQGYDESGAGVLNLHVASQRQEQLIPAVEIKASHKFAQEFSFALNAGLGYDLLNDQNTVSAGFAGGGGVFVTQGPEPSPWIVRSGAGFSWKRNDGLDLTIRYDHQDRGGTYNDQTASLKLRMPF